MSGEARVRRSVLVSLAHPLVFRGLVFLLRLVSLVRLVFLLICLLGLVLSLLLLETAGFSCGLVAGDSA